MPASTRAARARTRASGSLCALLERRTPLRVPGPVDLLAGLPDSPWRELLLLQAWWGVPGAVEKHSERIRLSPDARWAELELSIPFGWTYGSLIDVLDFFPTGESALWSRYAPPASLPALLQWGTQGAAEDAEQMTKVLNGQPPDALRRIEKDLVRLFENAAAFEELPAALVLAAAKAGGPALDPWVARALRNAANDGWTRAALLAPLTSL